jgi:hypothetical protein
MKRPRNTGLLAIAGGSGNGNDANWAELFIYLIRIISIMSSEPPRNGCSKEHQIVAKCSWA